jgi:hypothetical protein
MSGRIERIVLALALCLVPVLAASGLAVPLPAIVERVAAALVPFASADALLADTALASGHSGSIVLVERQHPGGAAPVGRAPRAVDSEPVGHSHRSDTSDADISSPVGPEQTPSPGPPGGGPDEDHNAPAPPDRGPTDPADKPRDTPTGIPDAPSDEGPNVQPDEPDTKPRDDPTAPNQDPDPTPSDEPDPTPKDEPGAIDVPIVGPVEPPPLPPVELPGDPLLDPPKLPPIGLPLGA